MREVQRLPDDVVLFWRALPSTMTLQQWRRLNPNETDRETIVQRYAKTRIPVENANDDKSIQAAAPVDIPGYTWWLYARGDGARQFDTTSGDLEPDTIWIGPQSVMYRDGVNDLEEAKPDEVIITRDAQNVPIRVQRKVTPIEGTPR